MFKSFSTLVVALLATFTTSSVLAQDFNAMNAQFDAALNSRMQATSNNMVQTNMNDPHIQQQYRVYLSQGGQLDFAAYCFRYAETGGFSEQGYRNMMQTTQQINARDTANMQAYHNHVNTLWSDTRAWQNQIHDSWAVQRGENLSATSPFVNSNDGSSYQLPNTMFHNETRYDSGSGNWFHNDFSGQMWMNNGNGWWNQMYGPN